MPDADRGIRLPLTAAQEGVWAAQRLNPANPRYNCASYLEIHGPVDAGLLGRAVRIALAEAEALRVRLDDDGGPGQTVRPVAETSPLDVLDLSAGADPRAAAEEWMRADLSRPVDLTRGPLVRHVLVKESADSWLLYLRYHHVVMDGLGHTVHVRRIAAVYTALTAGAEPPPYARSRCATWSPRTRPTRTRPPTPATAPTGWTGSPTGPPRSAWATSTPAPRADCCAGSPTSKAPTPHCCGTPPGGSAYGPPPCSSRPSPSTRAGSPAARRPCCGCRCPPAPPARPSAPRPCSPTNSRSGSPPRAPPPSPRWPPRCPGNSATPCATSASAASSCTASCFPRAAASSSPAPPSTW